MNFYYIINNDREILSEGPIYICWIIINSTVVPRLKRNAEEYMGRVSLGVVAGVLALITGCRRCPRTRVPTAGLPRVYCVPRDRDEVPRDV